MRRFILVFMMAFLFVSVSTSYAGFDFLKKVMDTVEKKAGSKIGKSINKGIDKTEKNVKGGGEKSTGESSESYTKSPEKKGKTESSSSAETSKQELKAWSKYDFVPGDEIIFQDDLRDEENGEFPSRWDLLNGNIEVAEYGVQNVINFASSGGKSGIAPLMTEKGDYLPEKFTIEFDAYFSEFCTAYTVYLWDKINQKPPKYIPFVNITPQHVTVQTFGSADVTKKNYPFWEHMAISFNKRALKVYFGEKRVMNIPNLRAEPMGLTILSRQCHKGKQALIKNIRIARGSKKLYDRIMSDGKFVTSGILFDVNSPTMKRESMGVINRIVKMMKKHQDLRLSVEGHTDSDGKKSSNQELSEKRAAAVKDALVDSGIAPSRLKTKGHGESKPVNDNSTAEGKANNRRVEFVKI
ncbi:MAG: OmpA family protein [Desulfobacterales bacterium]|nr:OmpA family protein [Desulfobacterales bacterium]